ncbi:MAG: hypothetical protein LBC92_02600 [Rickettsiales bacterium]|jgi:beta-1,4-N-acetylgalactosaminyltransferase|nr:hypothetical protein [Rickettsiales bacterium]
MLNKKIIGDKVFLKIFGITIFTYYLQANGKIFKPILYKRILKILTSLIFVKKYRKIIRGNIDYIVGKTLIMSNREREIILGKSEKEVYGCIRVRNEIITLEASLNSILPTIKKGVIAYNDCSDGSDIVIENFCKKNMGFIPAKYPYSFNDFPNLTKNQKMTQYSNFALDFIPKNEWVMKIDVDQIYDSDKIRQNINLISDNNDCVIPTRLQSHYDGENLYILKNKPFLDDADHWILLNKYLEFTDCNPKDERKDYESSCENLSNTGRRHIYGEISSYHFPFMKKNRNEVDYNNLMLFDDFIKDKEQILSTLKKRKTFILDDKMLDKNYIMNIVEKFHNF